MKSKLLIIFLTLTYVTIGNAQSLKKGVRKYEKLRYIKSIEELLKVANTGNPPSEALEKLANAYYFNNKMADASKWYDKLLVNNNPSTPEVYYRYAMSLKSQSKYDEAKKWMDKYVQVNPSDSRSVNYQKQPDYLEVINSVSGNYELDKIDFNSKTSDFGTAFYKDGIVFASSREEGRIYKWNSEPFLDLYYKSQNGKIEELSKKLNTKFHESSVCFTNDGNTIYFTRNNYYKGKEKRNKERVNGLKIYTATLKKGNWVNIKPLPFNSDDYNVAHPALSPDGKKLYFSSDMPGTLGKSDIYVVDVMGDNGDFTYSEPQNLGETINTSGRENFPYVSKKGKLYFSSDGHQGLGGLDVFKVDAIKNENPVNIGKPINSPQDDFGFIIDDDKETGYFTSNREGGLGNDDIYKFNEVKCDTEVSGTVVDEKTKEKLGNATVIILDENDKEVERFITKSNGSFSYQTTCLQDKEFTIKATKDDYNAYTNTFSIASKNATPVVLSVDMIKPEPVVKAAEVGTDLFKLLNLNPIYFDLNKALIRPDAQAELQKVINYMKEFPTVKIDVRSHTDARGSDKYNLKLSKRRNESTKNWIIRNGGIEFNRISGDGYGETMIINQCTNGVKCQDYEHEQNRRSEFIVVGN